MVGGRASVRDDGLGSLSCPSQGTRYGPREPTSPLTSGARNSAMSMLPLSFSPWMPTKRIRGTSEAGSPEPTPAQRVCTEDFLVLWLPGENIPDSSPRALGGLEAGTARSLQELTTPLLSSPVLMK